MPAITATTPEHDIGIAPAEARDQPGRERRHHQCSDPDPADGEARREAAPPDEPALHGAQRRDVGATDAGADPDAVGGVDLEDGLRLSRQHHAKTDQRHANGREPARTPAIGKRPGDDAETEIQEAREREHQRHRAARGAELAARTRRRMRTCRRCRSR